MTTPSEPTVAFLSTGRLFLKPPGEDPGEIQSAFAGQVMERQARTQEVHGWKSESGVWGSMGMAPPDLAAWERAEQRTPVRFEGVTVGDEPGDVYYILGIGDMGGLFRYSTKTRVEHRLMHRNGFVAKDLSRHPHTGEIVVAVTMEDGSTVIQVGEKDGRFLQGVTAGDAVDQAPHWVPGGGRRVVYQSAGIGRDEQGFAVGMAPFGVELLDLESQQIESLHAEDGQDLLQPRLLADGTLYYIRRPYEAAGARPADPVTILKDIVLFPFRLGRAVVHFLNFFSMMFSGKPLMTSGGPPSRVTDDRYRMIWGRMIDTRRAMQQAQKNKSAGLVPNEWQLIRRTAAGEDSVLAERVVSFDVAPDGTIVHTDGQSVFLQTPDKKSRTLATHDFVERVAIVG